MWLGTPLRQVRGLPSGCTHAAQLFLQVFSIKQEPACLPAFQIRLSPAGTVCKPVSFGVFIWRGPGQAPCRASLPAVQHGPGTVNVCADVCPSGAALWPPRGCSASRRAAVHSLGHHTAPTHSQFRCLCSGLHYNTERCPEIPLDIFIIL